MVFSAAVEGPSDEVALRKIVRSVGGELGHVYGRNGKSHILRSLAGYNSAARFQPWIVLVDLDAEACVVVAKKNWLPAPSGLMCLRIAVRELEAWLLADRERFADYFAVSPDLVPPDPDQLDDPKLTLIKIVRRSRRSAIRADMVPDHALGQSIGPAYAARIMEFIESDAGWRVESASGRSPSLRRAVTAISAFQDRDIDLG
jgi:hypothetical protein